MRATILLGLVMALTACGKPDNAPGPGGVTVGEARALDEAAEMIEAQRLPPTAITAPPAQPVATAQPSGPPPKR
jgi:hypothetical protein